MQNLTTQDHKARGEIFAKSLFFGNITPEQGATISIMCQESGMTIGQWMTSNNIVHDRPAMRADAMLAGFLAAGGSYSIVQRDSERAAIRMERGPTPYEAELKWSSIQDEPYTKVRDKKTGALVTNPKYETPRSRMQMLWARLVSDAVRAFAPDVNHGLYTPEEVEDIAGHSVPSPATAETAPDPMETRPARVERPAQPAAAPAQAEKKQEPTPNEASAPDYSVMPIGGSAGTPFAAMPAKHLSVVLKAARDGKTPGLTADYIPAIEAALANAKEA